MNIFEEPDFDGFDLEHEGRYHRVQVDGHDLVSIEACGDTAWVIVWSSTRPDAEAVWQGSVDIAEREEVSET